MSKRALTALAVMAIAATAVGQSAPATQPAPASQPALPKVACGEVHTLAVQYAGRVMPLDTLAREMVWEVTGKRAWGKANPVLLLLAWTWQPEDWQRVPMVLVGDPALQEQIGLAAEGKHFTYAELSTNEKLADYRKAAEHGAAANQVLPPAQRAMLRNVLQVGERLRLLEMIFQDQVIRFVPPVQDKDGAWMAVGKVGTQPGIEPAIQEEIVADWNRMREAFLAGEPAPFKAAIADLVGTIKTLHSPAWARKDLIEMEVVYNLLRPFQKGWWFTLLAMSLGLVSLGVSGWWYKIVRYLAWMSLLNGFMALTVGLAMRWKFAGHAPVSNMYESLVFMGWGVAAVGIVMMLIARVKPLLPIVAGVATAILVVADTAPLDSTASVLMPVLRNTIWLTFHVQTIMLAYSAFALTMGLGHVQAVRLVYGRGADAPADSLGKLLYGMTLVGCVFLTAGIILGAVWANESWGRYWYWDPKETWSLITLLGYMAVLHGRRVGWFGPFGLAIASILCFLLVIMTYYGVNLLGVGQHAYATVSGGLVWVLLYVAAEVVFMLWIWGAHSSRQAKADASSSTAIASSRGE